MVHIAIATGTGGHRLVGDASEIPEQPSSIVCVALDGTVTRVMDPESEPLPIPGWRYQPFVVAGTPLPFCESDDPEWILVYLSSGSGGERVSGEARPPLPATVKTDMAKRNIAKLEFRIRVSVNEEGHVADVTFVDPIDPPPDAVEEWTTRIMAWRFTPFRLSALGDRPLPFRVYLLLRYHLTGL
jgi:hypothetical protein